MSLAPETPASIRHRWPPGIFGGLGYLHDHVIFRFNHPVDWPQAMAAEIWHVPKEQSPADAADSQPGETPFSYSWDSPMTTFVSKSIRLINHCANVSVLLGGLWVAVIATSATLCFFGIKSFNEAKSDLQDQARTYSHLIAAHDRYGLTLADALVLGVMDQLEWSDFNLPMSTDRHAKVVEILNRHKARLPGIASFTIIGADGIRRAGVVNKDGTDLSSRGYFQTIKAGKDSYMSNAEDGLASGKTGIHIARRFAGKDNTFGGVVVLNLAIQDVFYPFYFSLNLGPNSRTTIQDAQKVLLVFPANPNPAATAGISATVSKMIASGSAHGMSWQTDPIDHIERVTAFERLEGSNVVATVSLPAADSLASARFALLTAFFASLASFLTGVGATVIIARTRLVADARDQAVKGDGEKRKFIQNVNAAIEEERRSIAVEIHDELNATVIGARLESQNILALAAKLPYSDEVEKIKKGAQSIVSLTLNLYQRGRAIVTRLRPEVLDTLGLVGAVEEMVRNYDDLNPACRFTFQTFGDLANIDGALSIAAYRIVQEALSNVVKHSGATQAAVVVSVPAGADSLRLSIRDNGKGFDQAAASRGIGAIGMTERVFAFSGHIEFRTAPGKGTEVDVELPLKGAVPA